MKTATHPTPRAFAAIVVLAVVLMGAYMYIPIPIGAQFNAHLVGSLSSSSASPGQTFQIVAASPLIVQGNIVVNEGATGAGHVVSVKAAAHGKPASVAVQLDSILAVDGQQLQLAATKPASSDTSSGSYGSSKAPRPLIFGAGGPFAKNFPKGKSVEVGPDLVFPAYVGVYRTVTINQ